MGSVRRRKHGGFRPETFDRHEELLQLPVPNGMWQSPIASNAASAAPAANGPALYVVTIRWPAVMPEAA